MKSIMTSNELSPLKLSSRPGYNSNRISLEYFLIVKTYIVTFIISLLEVKISSKMISRAAVDNTCAFSNLVNSQTFPAHLKIKPDWEQTTYI